MSERATHPIFVAHPIDGTVDVGGVAEPTPYHLYDGTLLLVGGTVDGAEAAASLRPQALHPVLDTAGRALAAVWLGDFSDASLGPHHELQVSLLTTRMPTPAVAAHPYAALKALTRREVLMVCLGLWNNTDRVVRYNREHLALGAQRMHSTFTNTAEQLVFRATDADDVVVAEAALTLATRQAPRSLWRAMAHLGWSGMAAGWRTPFLEVSVVNTLGAHATQTQVAPTWSKPERVLLRDTAASDRLALRGTFARLGFVPGFVEQMHGVRFVYGRPAPLDLTVSAAATMGIP